MKTRNVSTLIALLLLSLATIHAAAAVRYVDVNNANPAAPLRIARSLGRVVARCACLRVAVWLAALAFVAYPARADVTEAWVQRYSNVVTNSADRAIRVVRDAAGDIIVAGSTENGITGEDMLTIKYSGTDGSALWQKRYNGPANSDDHLSAVALDASGNVLVTGSSIGSGGSVDYYTAKYAAADGALLWEKRYNGPANGADEARAVAVDGSGNVVVTGDSYNGTNSDYYTAKYAGADGALLWEKRYNGPANNEDQAKAVEVDGTGNVVVTGSSASVVRHTVFGLLPNPDYYTAKYAAADGALLWEKRYNNGNGDDQAQAVAVDGSGNVVVTGFSVGGGAGGYYYTAKYAAADGALLWEKRGPPYWGAMAAAVDGSGNVVVTGSSGGGFYTAKYAAADGALLWEKGGPSLTLDASGVDAAVALAVDGSGDVVVTGSSEGDYYTAKYATMDGALLWEKRYNSPANSVDLANAVAVDGSGNVVVTGDSQGDYYTAKYAAANGALLWEKRHNGGPANSDDGGARAVAADENGNVIVTGTSFNGSNHDYYTAKYAAANGALVWGKRYNGPANSEDLANAVAVDGSGNVVVTGYSGNYPKRDYYTAKYAAGDGALLWEKRYNGPANFDDGANAVAVDSSGNVMVTGYSSNVINSDYYTAKYAAANGALLWQKRYNGPANFDDTATAVAVDGSGNVVVTGWSSVSVPDSSGLFSTIYYDYYTAKYAAADGALLWEQRYNGPGNSYDFARAVAVDGSGNVVVTGSSASGGSATSGFIYDYYTAKYAAADGALLWEQRYHGPANSDDGANAVAVDSSGNVMVTGYSSNGTNSDYYTAKYAAANGALLWEQRYNGPANGDDSAYAVAVEGSGNVVVTGNSSNGTNNDYYTAKYAAADGALLWEKRYNGPANGDDRVDFSRSLALGPNGMIVVSGPSDGNFGSGASFDYATVVYREILPPISIDLVATGVRLRFVGVPGSGYSIERAPAVTGRWSTLDTLVAPISGLIEYVDTNALPGSAFYRTRTP